MDRTLVFLIVLIALLSLFGKKKRKKRSYPKRRNNRQSSGASVWYPQRTTFKQPRETSPGEKGRKGERFVATSELARLPQDLFSVFNDVLLPSEDGTTQIDHIVIADQGIFVIETKNYQGTIYGSDKESEWYQYLANQQFAFHNPLHQNYGHVKALSRALQLPDSSFVPILVFPNQTGIKAETQHAVLHVYELADYIRAYSSVHPLSDEQVKNACEQLRSVQLTDPAERAQHILQVKKKVLETQEKIAEGICPRCGGKLVLREGKYGAFYGCSNYPKCHYTKH